MMVSILGCGWYGRALAAALLADGITVKGSVSGAEKLDDLAVLGIASYVIDLPDNTGQPGFFDTDVLIVSIPPKFRKGERDAFIPKIQATIAAIERYGVKRVIYTSSTAVYGDEQGTVDELAEPMPGDEHGELLLKAEQLFQNQADLLTTIIRFGGLVGPGRHPGRFFAGKKDIPNGKGAVNMVHLDDIVGITQSIITQNKWEMVFNACSPDHPSRAEFYTCATQLIGSQLPEFRDELLANKTVNSVKVGPVLNYKFKYQNWAEALLGGDFLF